MNNGIYTAAPFIELRVIDPPKRLRDLTVSVIPVSLPVSQKRRNKENKVMHYLSLLSLHKT